MHCEKKLFNPFKPSVALDIETGQSKWYFRESIDIITDLLNFSKQGVERSRCTSTINTWTIIFNLR